MCKAVVINRNTPYLRFVYTIPTIGQTKKEGYIRPDKNVKQIIGCE